MKNQAFAFLFFVALWGCPVSVSGVTTPWTMTDGLITLVTWEEVGGGGVGRALTVVKWFDDREVRRTFVETPQGDRAVLTREYFPTRGISQLRFQADESTWAATLIETSGLKFDSVAQLAQPEVFAAKWSEADRPLARTLEAPGIPRLEGASTIWDGTFNSVFLRQMESEGRAEALAETMPVRARSAVLFLKSILEREDCSGSLLEYKPLLEILSGVLVRHDESGSGAQYKNFDWRLLPEVTKKGTSPEAASLDFARRFKSVRAENLLADPGQ
jgi:hypothetical protein